MEGRSFGVQSLRNGDRPAWGRRADGGGLAGGAAVALAEKNGLYPKTEGQPGQEAQFVGRRLQLRHEAPSVGRWL